LNVLENIFDQNHPNVAEVLETMAQLHHKAGNAIEVAKLAQHLEQSCVQRQAAYEPIVRAVE